MRTIQRGEILYEQGDNAVPFFAILSGELEIVRPLGTAAVETLVVVTSTEIQGGGNTFIFTNNTLSIQLK